MDKRLINAVAGSGKTTYIIERLNLEERFLIFTYTENNYENIKYKIISKFGYIPQNIYLMTYYSFLYNFCYRPYLSDKISDNGIVWKQPHSSTLKLKRTDKRFYIDTYGRLYSNRLAKLLDTMNVEEAIRFRLCKYFDKIFVDEVQDFAGHDFNFLLNISDCELELHFVGDYFQHTFDTSRDGNINSSLHSTIETYFNKFKSKGFTIDTETLKKSWRCSKSICNFISQELDIRIDSNRTDTTSIKLVEEINEINSIVEDDKIIKLFYQNYRKYNCTSLNWSISKGLDCFQDVCVILNATTLKNYKENKLHELNSQTKNKFYVACTRASGNLYFVKESDINKYKISTPSDNT